MSMSSEKYLILENSLHDKEKSLNENSKLLINYQIEVKGCLTVKLTGKFCLIRGFVVED